MRTVSRRSVHFKLAFIILFVLTFSAFWLAGRQRPVGASAQGPSASHTNAPGEDNCTSCHVGTPVNTGGGSVQISGFPHDYIPGRTYNVSVTTAHDNAVIYGFQLTAIDNLGRGVGTFAPAAGQSPAQTKVVQGFVGGNIRRYIEHTIDGLIPVGFNSKTWNFTWTAPATRVGKISLYAAGNGANGDGSPGGDNIYTSSTGTLSGTGISNFANDLKSDLAVYRPSQGIWYSYNLDDGTFKIVNWGLATDKIAPGDYDGDGVTDYAVFRPSNGNWYLFQSTAGISGATWGLSGDVPAAADYDGDGKTDIAIFRPSNGVWYVLKSTGGFTIVNWGLAEDRPVPGDYDADGKTDIAVFRPSSGVWYVLKSTGGFSFNAFGTTGDKPVQADYDGDGITDMAIYRPSTGHWWLWRSTLGITAIGLGLATDIPAPADFDGDGSTDLAVFRPSSGTWIFRRSSDNAVVNGAWGTDGDRPVANGYIPE